jgi:D-3-phosphoglycerate dehydrogenase
VSIERVLVTCVQMQSCLDLFRGRFDERGIELVVPVVSGQQLTEDELLDLMSDVTGVIAGDDPFSARVFDHSPRLRVISKWGIGTDGIDKAAAERRNVVVTNTPSVFGDEVADMALGYVLLLGRRQHEINKQVRAGSWPKVEGETFRGQTALVVGLGSIGSAIVTRLEAIGMTVVGCDPAPDSAARMAELGVEVLSLDHGLGVADWVVLAVPLSPESHHLIGQRELSGMRLGARLVNVGRGPVVDETALVAALQSGALGGAALDVYEVEPLPSTSPLRDLPNVVLGAHNGSNTRQAVERASGMAVDNLLAHLQGGGTR